MVAYLFVVQTFACVPLEVGDIDARSYRPNDGACTSRVLLGGFDERNDWGVELVNNVIEFLPVGCGGHSVMGFMGESFVDTGVDKDLAFLEGNSELADAEFIIAGADVLFDVFFRRHGYSVNQINEEMVDAGYK